MRMSRTTILFYCIALWISLALSNSIPEDLDGSGGDDQDFSGSGDGDSSPTTAMASLDVTMSPSSSREQASTTVEEEMTSLVTTTTSPEMAEKTTSENQETTEGAVHIPVADRTTSRPVSTAEASSNTTTAAVALPGVVSDKELSSTAVNPTRSSVPLSTSASIVDSDAKPESTADSTTPASITESSSSSTSASVNVVDLDAKPEGTTGSTTTVSTTPASTTSAGVVESDAKSDGTVASNITDDITGPIKSRKLQPGHVPVDNENSTAETNVDDLYLEDATVSQTNNGEVQGDVPQISQPNEFQEASKEGDNAMSQGIMERKDVLGGVIAGGIVGLAFAVLLVVLMVYRMKKKDEGSYSLDDQKNSNGGYQKPQKQEEFLA
ncbi:syndecan-1-like [Acipenser oxyrinchus oxyrinchus]|uniref:Syndecan n=1 Tax=Acipenser oxyrinchus oxyrinchus TaxID=40147 RepID=A0AAD8G9N1_ACIOX|nr:syndecan-1-like [Acipenser oxyrinchus oxyrinchus]